MYKVSDHVRVRQDMPPGHVRTPFYLRGRRGVIERALGVFGNPEELAYGRRDSKKHLFRVRFSMAEVWGSDVEYPEDTLDAEIFEHWLERAE